jgi:hypothetical protein
MPDGYHGAIAASLTDYAGTLETDHSYTALCMREPTSTGEPSFDATRFLEKNLASKGEPAKSNRKTGLSCCGMHIQPTSAFEQFLHNQRQLDDNRTQAGQKSTEEPFERGLRSCKALSCVARVADARAFGISAMAPC